MNTKYVIDTNAWIEFFNGSKKGGNAKQYIESGFAITPMLVIAELSDKYKREARATLKEDLVYVQEMSEIVPFSIDIALLSGVIKNEMRLLVKDFGLGDSIILATARTHGGKVISGDPHFAKVEDAIMI